MRNVCGCKHFYDLEVLCKVLQPFGHTFAAVSRSSLVKSRFLLDPKQKIDPAEAMSRSGSCWYSKFSVLQKVCFPFLVRRGLRPLGHSQVEACSLQSLLRDNTAGVFEQLHSDEKVKIIHIHLRFFTRLDHSVGCHHCYGGLGSLWRIQLS